MANVEWIADADGVRWWVKGPVTYDHGTAFRITQGVVTYRPDEQQYSVIYSPYKHPERHATKKFDSLEEAHAWLMTLARME